MNDRQPTKPNRIKITFDDGTVKYGYMERADEPTVAGTPLNKANLFNGKNSDRYACDVPSEAFELIGQEVQLTVPTTGYTTVADEDGYYEITLAVAGMKEAHRPKFSPLYTTASAIEDIDEAFNCIKRVITGDGTVTLKVTESPLTEFTLRLWGA